MRKFYTDKQCLKMLYILFAVGLLCAHYFFITGKNDDAWFAEILDKYSLMEYLSMRYELWTSRIFIETAEVFLTRMNPWIWKCINVLVIMLLVYECNAIWGRVNPILSTVIFMLIIPLFPLEMLNSAGWIVTTINYLWSITIGIFTFLPLYKYVVGKRVYIYEYVLGVVACLFSCCQEQVVAVLLTSYLLYGLYCKIQHCKLPVLWWVFLVISVVSIIFVLTCPGNENRSALETATWFQEFAGMTLNQKVLMGYLTTFSYFISCGEYNTIFLLFSFVLALTVFYSTNNVPLRIIAAYPFGVTLIWGYVGRLIVNTGITTHIYWLGLIQNDRLAELSVYSKEHIVLECCIFFTILCAVIFSLYVVFGKTINWWVTIIILFAGLCSKMIIGLSPTVYVSGTRTATLGHICLMILVFICIQKCIEIIGVKRSLSYYIPFYAFTLASTLFWAVK